MWNSFYMVPMESINNNDYSGIICAQSIIKMIPNQDLLIN